MHLNLREEVLLALGIIGLAKSAWGLIQPFTLKKLAGWWARAAMQVNTLAGCVCIIAGVALR